MTAVHVVKKPNPNVKPQVILMMERSVSLASDFRLVSSFLAASSRESELNIVIEDTEK